MDGRVGEKDRGVERGVERGRRTYFLNHSGAPTSYQLADGMHRDPAMSRGLDGHLRDVGGSRSRN